MHRIAAVIAAMLISQLITGEACADEDFNLRFGAKGTITGLLWSAPDNLPPVSDAFWGDDQFYYGGGGGIFVEGNAFKYLALEMDFLFETNSLTFNYTITSQVGSLEFDYYTNFDQLRIPMLIKGVLPLGETIEMSLGIGPEFVVGLNSDVEIDRRTDYGLPSANQLADDSLAGRYFTETVGGTFFDVDFGVAVKVWKLIIPIDLRAAFNLSQPANYEERVARAIDPMSSKETGTVKAIESMHFAALIGVGYLLPL